ncbi:hypothetical protein IV203_011363 [Nitzschia inconspicua]|uniref:Uncharacterized protein n=1 Tax=Nitzschia inconspicua TaxID=303405 RepID=A0A9K3KSK8_9STRA|nr:hypothetical protein IV203_011363 [Nitzschia inconspicua]
MNVSLVRLTIRRDVYAVQLTTHVKKQSPESSAMKGHILIPSTVCNGMPYGKKPIIMKKKTSLKSTLSSPSQTSLMEELFTIGDIIDGKVQKADKKEKQYFQVADRQTVEWKKPFFSFYLQDMITKSDTSVLLKGHT